MVDILTAAPLACSTVCTALVGFCSWEKKATRGFDEVTRIERGESYVCGYGATCCMRDTAGATREICQLITRFFLWLLAYDYILLHDGICVFLSYKAKCKSKKETQPKTPVFLFYKMTINYIAEQ